MTAQGGLFRVLKTQCHVSPAWVPTSSAPQPQMVPFDAIWDTGATNSVITQAVVDDCGLVATGMANVDVVGGSLLAETYLVNMGLPNGVAFTGLRVTKGTLPGSVDILIGMDIINRGDFVVTNLNGVTKFSFRVPSVEHIDFVEKSKRPQFQHGGKPTPRRPKRPMGSGKKGKKGRRGKR